MIADVRVRICMPYRSVGVRSWRFHGGTAAKSSQTVSGKVTRPRSDDREGAGVSTQRCRRCGDEWSASWCRQPVTMLLPACLRSDLIEYLSTRRGVRSPKSPTLDLFFPPPQHAHSMCSCCSASARARACVCARSFKIAELWTYILNPKLDLSCWLEDSAPGEPVLEWHGKEKKVHEQQRHLPDPLGTDSDLDPCAAEHRTREQRTTAVTRRVEPEICLQWLVDVLRQLVNDKFKTFWCVGLPVVLLVFWMNEKCSCLC